MKTYQDDNQINFEFQNKWGKSEMEVSHVNGNVWFEAETSDGERAEIRLTKEETKELIEFLKSKI